MIATIDARGTLTIVPESDLERYALDQWVANNQFDPECCALRVGGSSGRAVARVTKRRVLPELPAVGGANVVA